MTPPTDPDQPAYRDDDPLVAQPEITEPAVTEPVETPQPAPMPGTEPMPGPMPAPNPTEHTAESEHSAGSKVKAAAVLAGAAALANKVRQDAPKRWQEIREKRVAGRCVILLEVNGRQVAVGPYRDDKAARQDLAKATGVPAVIELVSPTGYFGPEGGEDTALR